MRRLALLTLGLGLALDAPASAQIAGRHDYGDVRVPDRPAYGSMPAGPSPAAEARDIRGDIRNLREAGAISRREARTLSREARAIARTGDSLSGGSARAVEAQLLALRSQVAAAQARRNATSTRR